MADIPPEMRRLTQEMLAFFYKTLEFNHTRDDVMRQVATEKYREEVELADRAGIEISMAWQVLGTWTEDGKGRIGYFARALEALKKEAVSEPPDTPLKKQSHENSWATCLYEIGRIHAGEGSPEVARDFFERALPHARVADEIAEQLTSPRGIKDSRIEGKIAAALLILDLPE